MIGLIDVATVYVPDGNGDYTQVDNAALPCRLALVTITAPIGGPRAELASARRLLWGPDYTLPETAQVAIGSERWNVKAGTLVAARGPNGSVQYQRADLQKAGA